MGIADLLNDPDGRKLIVDTMRGAQALLYLPESVPAEEAAASDDELLKRFNEQLSFWSGPMATVLEDSYPITRPEGGLTRKYHQESRIFG